MLKDRELLAKENFTEDEINGMTPEEIAEKAAKIRQDQVSIFDNFADAGVALGGLLMSGGAIAFGLATGNFPNTIRMLRRIQSQHLLWLLNRSQQGKRKRGRKGMMEPKIQVTN